MPYQIDITILTRDDMNAATPRVGSWTYHHVLPVRIYFATASLILRVVTHRDCWLSTKAVGKEALLAMCNNPHNKNSIRVYIDETTEDSATDDGIANHAKLCASPPFGGFGGPNPNQRTDDPHDQEEPIRPMSADKGWWATLKQIRQDMYEAFGQVGLPANGAVMSANKEIWAWCPIVEGISNSIIFAATAGRPAFDFTDWVCAAGQDWTTLPGNCTDNPVTREPMRLRIAREQRSYIKTAETSVDALRRRPGFRFLAQTDDYLNHATP